MPQGSPSYPWWAGGIRVVMFFGFLLILAGDKILESAEIDYSLLLGGVSEDT